MASNTFRNWKSGSFSYIQNSISYRADPSALDMEKIEIFRVRLLVFCKSATKPQSSL